MIITTAISRIVCSVVSPANGAGVGVGDGLGLGETPGLRDGLGDGLGDGGVQPTGVSSFTINGLIGCGYPNAPVLVECSKFQLVNLSVL